MRDKKIIFQRGFLNSIKNLIGTFQLVLSIFLLVLLPVVKIQEFSSIFSKIGFLLIIIPLSILLNIIGLFFLNLTPNFSIQENVMTTYFLGRKIIKQIHPDQIIKIKENKIYYKINLDKNLKCENKYFQIIDFLQIKLCKDKTPFILITKKTDFSPYDFINGNQQELNNRKIIFLTAIIFVLFVFLVYSFSFLFLL